MAETTIPEINCSNVCVSLHTKVQVVSPYIVVKDGYPYGWYQLPNTHGILLFWL